jgi:hypothetical protein
VCGRTRVSSLRPEARYRAEDEDVNLKPRVTAEKFERAYAERAGVSVETLRSWGRVVRPCSCDYELCEGWQSVSRKAAAEIDDPKKPWAR